MGETRDWLETHGGPGRVWCETAQCFVIKGSNKAKKIREKHTAPANPSEICEYPIIDTDENAKIIEELNNLSRKIGIDSYLITHGDKPVASIVVKRTEARCTVYATCFINERKMMFKGFAGGYGYNKETAAMCGLRIYPPTREYQPVVIDDGKERWYNQLRNAGFGVWQTL